MAWCGQNSLHLKQAQQRWLFHGYTEPSFFTNTPIEHRSIQTQLVVQRSGSIYTSNCTVVGQLTSMVYHTVPAGKRPLNGGLSGGRGESPVGRGSPADRIPCGIVISGVHKNIGMVSNKSALPSCPSGTLTEIPRSLHGVTPFSARPVERNIPFGLMNKERGRYNLNLTFCLKIKPQTINRFAGNRERR
jgi:hypothetical protein